MSCASLVLREWEWSWCCQCYSSPGTNFLDGTYLFCSLLVLLWNSMNESPKNPCLYFLIFFNPHMRIYLLIWETERERETMMWKTLISCLLYLPWTGDQTCKLDMCPDWEPNPWPFGVWDHAPTKWAIQPGQSCIYIEYIRWFPDFGQRTEHTLNLPYAMYFSRIF